MLMLRTLQWAAARLRQSAQTLAEQTRTSLVFLELAAGMLFVFGAAGMALSAMGIYGLVSHTVRT